jgi:hypothetical protein
LPCWIDAEIKFLFRASLASLASPNPIKALIFNAFLFLAKYHFAATDSPLLPLQRVSQVCVTMQSPKQ